MNTVFRDAFFILHCGENIHVSWRRAIVKNQEKDYLKFDYKGISISVSYLTHEADPGGKTLDICRIMDTLGTDGLTENEVAWKINEAAQGST